MAGKKNVLGRGLASLLPDIEEQTENDKIFFECDIDIIFPNQYQPRTIFSEKSIAELTNSIKQQGIIQPLIVRKHESGYELIAGERRLRAAKKAGLKKVPVIVKNFAGSQLLEISIIENIQRQDINPIEEAYAYQRLIDDFSFTQEKIAQKIGKSRSAIANFLRLIKLSSPIKEALKNNLITMGHARALLSAENNLIQSKAFKTLLEKDLSVRETEKLIQKLNKNRTKINKTFFYNQQFTKIAESLSHKFSTKIKITKKGKKGKIEIEFKDQDDLDRVIKIMTPSFEFEDLGDKDYEKNN
jgi:ParB family transcriptional regulator, chromosome partitioning protein